MLNRFFTDIEELDRIDTSLIEKVLSPDFSGGRYFYDGIHDEWNYCLSGSNQLKPIGIVEDSIGYIDPPFGYCHLEVRGKKIAQISKNSMIGLQNWCIKVGLFYPVFVWRYSQSAISQSVLRRIEGYILVPKETDGVLLQLHANGDA